MANTATEQSDSCYVPDPRYTVLFLSNHNLHCTICKTTKLTLPSGPKSSRIQDSHPALLPCGHVFGEECLQSWLATQNTCPICRLSLSHELCSHPVNAFRLTMEDILFAPRTIPEGGFIGVQCADCTRQTSQRVTAELCLPLARLYYEVRQRYGRTGARADKIQMMLLKRDLDNVVEGIMPVEHRHW
jgi:ribosomal protein S27E